MQTGESFDTEVFEITIKDLADVRKRKGEWHFHWRSELKQVDRKVYKLVITGQPNILQGLVSVSNMGDHYYLHLAESAPMNFGEDKIYEGVGGNLFAFCCKLSLDNGNEGFIAFKSKTTLISHYEKTLGAVHIGNHQMIIYPNEALFLIDKYFKNRKK
ncbi:hypothetical protein [Mucilaginibacter mali]|uniref:hypothetical protein n=1 Tax=Mucilaginibacter mali TaxID=2740462 RepID=UPI00191D62FF|nr:hypothetical protein [Mucilaginibacter mali]